MGKTLFINDLTNPNVGTAISVKPIIQDFKNRYAKNYIKTTKIHCVIDKDKYIVHGIIPSEHNTEYIDPIFYDVILEFYPPNKATATEMSIRNYAVKVFSNSPSWMFNFTYNFAKSGCVPDFVPKSYYSEAALEEPNKITNPQHLFGIEKSVFMVLYHLELTTGFRKNRIKLIELYKTKPHDLLKKIMGQKEKLDEIQFEKKKSALKKAGDKKKQKTKSEKEADQRYAQLKSKKRSQESLYSDLTKGSFVKPIKSSLETEVLAAKVYKPGERALQKKEDRNTALRSKLASSLGHKVIVKKKKR